MAKFDFWTYPNIPPKIGEQLQADDKRLLIIGVIGKSNRPDCNKMVPLGVLNSYPIFIDHPPKEGQIQFYYNRKSSILYLHFETSFDNECMYKMLDASLADEKYDEFLTFSQRVRSRFARMFLFATQVCHLIIFVESGMNFDCSLLPIFKSLKIIREKFLLKFIHKLIKNSSTGASMGKPARMCTPRIIFYFENYPEGQELSKEAINGLEFEFENYIYKMLRNEFIVTNNNAMSLFAIPINQRFVYFNTDPRLHIDPIIRSGEILKNVANVRNFNEYKEYCFSKLRPHPGFARSFPPMRSNYNESVNAIFLMNHNFEKLIKDHEDEAFQYGFDDNSSKYKGRNHFVILHFKSWYETFKIYHKIFIENPDDPEFDAKDADYRAYLENFDKIIDCDAEFFATCCDIGYKKAYNFYNNPTLLHYSSSVHNKMVQEAIDLYMRYACGPNAEVHIEKLRMQCEKCWHNGKQQCEHPSLRGNPCIMAKHANANISEHSSGFIFISSCNCGHTQGRRDDPYTLRQANYDYYEFLGNNCNLCFKVKRIAFPVFEPSVHDFRPADYKYNTEGEFPKLTLTEGKATEPMHLTLSQKTNETMNIFELSQPLTASQGSHVRLSLTDNSLKMKSDSSGLNSSEESLNELVLKVGDKSTDEENERSICRQPSTTEYLSGMIHTESPEGVLPQFPSWSLVCAGSSSIYSHSTGLMEHFQSGFLSGSNFLLPWDVHVRLEHSASWAAERQRFRKMGEVFILKVFVGYEYECPRGHRFMMSAPDKILRGGSEIMRDSGSKVVYNNMPLYFPCPCRTSHAYAAQLMRIHVVTPKAPVDVMLDPKVKAGDCERTFTLGLPRPPKLTQSAYWVLRLPYIYQADGGLIIPPHELTESNAINYGYIIAGMFGVVESEMED
ncbi:protein SMG8 isoform X2 [Teleopsis dalmanni]|uniref:protein SMG8 isoform X2 n=1 Tax=Teleopsis dalmanni TaxID=139649 RepID=UPI0018CF5182|nr:protein SMG8 isoform X2 [Teleopsis dalmanni]